MDDQSYLYLKKKILKLTNIDLDGYKSEQMRRRLNSFMAVNGVENIVDYGYKLERDTDTLEQLRAFLTINVSEFFRDLNMFERLKTSILPQLLKNSRRLNIWSAGCSHGAEPYSIAMLLESISPFTNHRILATDVDEGALKQARAGGPYTPAEVKNVPRGLILKNFTFSSGSYMLSEKIKQKVEFRCQNLLCDEFETGFDLILCRNVTIYFTEEANKRLKQKFCHSLKEGGVLFIGSTEVMFNSRSIGLQELETCFYQKLAASNSPGIGARAGVALRA